MPTADLLGQALKKHSEVFGDTWATLGGYLNRFIERAAGIRVH